MAPRLETIVVGGGVFHLQYGPEDADSARQIAGALKSAVPASERWGRFSAPVLITIHPTHQALEAAAHREGYAWLRAWARYASVDLQSPRTWSNGRTTDAGMAQLLAHELTHCVMYQSAGSASDWATRRIPLWFREGMASVTAGQEHEGTGSQAHHRSPRDGDPLAALDPLYRSESELVYETAHQAFHFLLERFGEERIRRLIATMGEGQRFPEAFESAVGIPVQDFEGDFKRQHEASQG